MKTTKILSGIVLGMTFFAQSAEVAKIPDVEAKEKDATKKALVYTVGMKLPNKTYAGKAVNPVHMTVTYLGEANNETLARAKTYLESLHKMRPIQVVVGNSATFGTAERPVPVRLLKFVQADQEAALVNMHKELGQCEPGMPKKLETPNWHMSLKDDKLRNEFGESSENVVLVGAELFIKPLGPIDPVFVLGKE